jgi:hypothetical protein
LLEVRVVAQIECSLPTFSTNLLARKWKRSFYLNLPTSVARREILVGRGIVKEGSSALAIGKDRVTYLRKVGVS